jgi:hypothetical protein
LAALLVVGCCGLIAGLDGGDYATIFTPEL